jgi:hypothetical protein
MTQRGYLGIHAEVPTAQCLRSASVVNGAPQIKIHREAALEPTWFLVGPRSSCGSGLAREGGGSVKWMLGLLAPSRASSLPQVFCVVCRCCEHSQTHVGASLLAMVAVQLHRYRISPALALL